MNKGKVFVVSGPSGVGKGTVLAEVFSRLEHRWFSISATTRAPRPGEVDGTHYWFIGRDEFLRMIENNEFLEYAEYVGNYYGTPVKPIIEHIEAGEDVFLDVEVQGARQIRERMPEVISIFIVPPDIESLRKRLCGRMTESEEKISGRLERAKEELKLAPLYNYTVVNDTVENAADKIIGIIAAERRKQEEN